MRRRSLRTSNAGNWFRRFRTSLAQAFEVPFAGRQLDAAQLGLLFDQASGRLYVAGHKGTKATRKLSQMRL